MSETLRVSRVRWILVAILAATLALAGYWLLFTTFMIYDDEGYVLLSLRSFSEIGGLYGKVFSQYGPFFYQFHDLLHRLGIPFTNTSGRWLTLIYWFGTAAACAGLVARTTRSAPWTALTLACVFTYLWVMINEPMHPGGMVALGVAMAAWGGATLWQAGRVTLFAALAGVSAALLMLIKINVGAFLFAAVCVWLAVNSAMPRATRTLSWLAALACAALPVVLMRSLFDASWTRLYAFVFASASLGVLLALRAVAVPVVRWQTWLWFLGSFVVSLAGVIALTLLRGISLSDLIQGVLLDPLKHPGVYFFAMNWRTGTALLALVSLAIAATSTRFQWLKSERWRDFVAYARVITLLVFLAAALGLIPTSIAAWGMCYGSSLAWWFVIPLSDGIPAARTRAWIALLLVFQFLHGYPVAGSQINWGTFLWVPLLALGVADAFPRLGRNIPTCRTVIAYSFGLLATACAVAMTTRLAKIGHERYFSSQPLGLPGAERLRLPNDITYALRISEENLRAHAELLFSYPGIFSANLWTGLPTPTSANVTHWFSLLSDAQQHEIATRLAADPRAAVLVQRQLLTYLRSYNFNTESSLSRWIGEHMEPAIVVDDYEIWLHRGRKVLPLSTGFLEAGPPGERAVLLNLAALRSPVSTIEICDVLNPQRALFTLDAHNCTAEVTTTTLDAVPTAAAAPATFPLVISGPSQVRIKLPVELPVALSRRTLLVLRDADGAICAEVRLVPRR